MQGRWYPLTFQPVYKDYIWGGDRIPHRFHRPLPPGRYAESWEIADRPEGMSVVANGPLSGRTLAELVTAHRRDLVGTAAPEGGFPLLIKLIDARERLSLQVHPNDDTARRFGGEAKTEMWYALGAEPGACVFAGFKAPLTEAAFRAALAANRLQEHLQSIPLSAHEAVFIPGGRVHAICEGCLLLEVQQNSNTTYRVFDWGRVGDDGKPRPLHVEEAIRVIDFQDTENGRTRPHTVRAEPAVTVIEVVRCPWFIVERLELQDTASFENGGGSFHALFTAHGAVQIEGSGFREPVQEGVSVLMPAAVGSYTVRPGASGCRLLRARIA